MSVKHDAAAHAKLIAEARALVRISRAAIAEQRALLADRVAIVASYGALRGELQQTVDESWEALRRPPA